MAPDFENLWPRNLAQTNPILIQDFEDDLALALDQRAGHTGGVDVGSPLQIFDFHLLPPNEMYPANRKRQEKISIGQSFFITALLVMEFIPALIPAIRS